MPDPNTVLGKRKSIDATGDALVERPQKAARKWYRPQYVDIATQTDFALTVLEDDAPAHGGMVSVVDAHRRSQPSAPKILVTSAGTSSDSPPILPRTCVEQPPLVQRTDVAHFTASRKDLAPTLDLSAAASHTTKIPDTLTPALSAPVLAMSSARVYSAAATQDVGSATRAVPPSSPLGSAPSSHIPAVATSTLTYNGPNDVHTAPLLAPRLSASTPASTATSSARAVGSSGLSHPVVPSPRSTNAVPSSVRSGTTLATSNASPEPLPVADRLVAMGRGSRLRSTRGSWGEGRRYPRLQLATKIAARYTGSTPSPSPSPSPEPEEVHDAHSDLDGIPGSSFLIPSVNSIPATDGVRTTFLSQSSRSATLPPPQGDKQTVPPALASLARLNRLRRIWRELYPDESFDSDAFMKFVNTPREPRMAPRKQLAMKIPWRPSHSASPEPGASEEGSENDLDSAESQLAVPPEPEPLVTGTETSSTNSKANDGEYKLVQVGHHVVRVASRKGVPLGKRLASAVIHSSSVSASPAVSSGRVPALDGILDRSRSLASLAASLSYSSDSLPTTNLASGGLNPSTASKLVQVGNRVLRVPARADSFTSLLKDPSATRVDEPTPTSERPPASTSTTSRSGLQNISSTTGTVSTPRPVQGGKTLPPVQATKKKTRRKNKKKQKQSAAADANGGAPHQT